MKLRVRRGLGIIEAPFRPLFARQNVPTGIPSDIQTDSPDADDAESTPGDDETRTQTRVVTVTKTDSGGPAETGEATTNPPSSTKGSESGGGLSGGAIAGLIIGILSLLFLILGAIFFFWRRRKQKQKPAGTTPTDSTDENTLGAVDPAVAQLDSAPVAEVEGTWVAREASELPGSPLPSIPVKARVQGE